MFSSLLDFNRNSGQGNEELDMWIGYAAFHASDYKRAMLEFEAVTHAKKVWRGLVFIFIFCTYRTREALCYNIARIII